MLYGHTFLQEEAIFEFSIGKTKVIDIDKIKKIKETKPDEYTGKEELKKFVDANYKDLEKASEILEKEKNEINKETWKSLIPIAGGWVSLILASTVTSIAALSGIFLGVGFIGFVLGIVGTITDAMRAENDTKAMDDLNKIKVNLIKIKDSNKLDKTYNEKIGKLINKIEDASISITGNK